MRRSALESFISLVHAGRLTSTPSDLRDAYTRRGGRESTWEIFNITESPPSYESQIEQTTFKRVRQGTDPCPKFSKPGKRRKDGDLMLMQNHQPARPAPRTKNLPASLEPSAVTSLPTSPTPTPTPTFRILSRHFERVMWGYRQSLDPCSTSCCMRCSAPS